ncbi:gluconate 5-dehydrogenase, partial [Eggerthia catenaformis]
MTSKLFDLTGRTALVTGSSRGLGRAIAQGLGDAGARLVLNGRTEKPVATVAEEMRKAGYQVSEAAFDVTSEAAVRNAFERLDGEGLEVDILVNNAGIQHRQPIVELSFADWQRVIDTNLTSAFLVGREAARRMIPRGHGKIINIGSLTSEV